MNKLIVHTEVVIDHPQHGKILYLYIGGEGYSIESAQILAVPLNAVNAIPVIKLPEAWENKKEG